MGESRTNIHACIPEKAWTRAAGRPICRVTRRCNFQHTNERDDGSVGARVSTVYKINTGACSRSERATDDGQDEARRMEAASVLH